YTKISTLQQDNNLLVFVSMIVQGMTPRQREQLKESKKALEPKINHLKKELAKLRASGKADQIHRSLFKNLTDLVRPSDATSTERLTREKKLMMDIKTLEVRRDLGVKVDRDLIEKYIKDIHNPD